MKIDTLKLVSFESLSPGAVFELAGKLWMRVYPIETAMGHEINAVHLRSGRSDEFGPNQRVYPVPTAMVVRS